MPFRNLDELTSLLVRLRLVEPQQIDDCVLQLPRGSNEPADLLEVLGRAHHLTPWQVSQLQKGRTDSLVLGDYKLLYKNASGSFARVWRACSVSTGKMVGLKVLRERWARDPQAVAEFRKEAELCMGLRHPNIVPIYDVGSQGDWHFFSMEFIEGGNLRDFINIRKKLSPEEAVRYTLDMARGLEYAFGRGVTHRDLKMTNVLLSIQGVARLVDFGLAGNEQSSGSGDDMQRALEYAALEKHTGVGMNDPRSDLFFLGAIAYELLSGTPAWQPTRNRQERRSISRYNSVRPLRSAAPDVPVEVTEVVERLLKIDPHSRYQTATELVKDLESLSSSLGAGGTTTASASEAEQDGAAEASEKAEAGRTRESRKPQPTVLCVESRLRHQDALRDYLSRHGFRVLMLSNLDRALARLDATPPNCMVLMGEALGNDGIVRGFQQAAEQAGRNRLAVIAVLSEKQVALRKQLPTADTARILVQPVTLRGLRREILLAIQRLRKRTGQASQAD